MLRRRDRDTQPAGADLDPSAARETAGSPSRRTLALAAVFVIAIAGTLALRGRPGSQPAAAPATVPATIPATIPATTAAPTPDAATPADPATPADTATTPDAAPTPTPDTADTPDPAPAPDTPTADTPTADTPTADAPATDAPAADIPPAPGAAEPPASMALADPRGPVLAGRADGSALVVDLGGGPVGVAAQSMSLYVAAADACPTCWSRRVPLSGSPAFVETGAATIRVPDLLDGDWQARLVSLASGTPVLVATSDPVRIGDGVADLPAPTVTASAAGGQLIVTVTGGPVGPQWTPVHLFVAPPDACATCFTRSSTLSTNETFVATGSATITLPTLNGTWQARLVTDAPGRRTVLGVSEPVVVSDGPPLPTPTVRAQVSGDRVEVTVEKGPVGELWTPTYLFLAAAGDCPTCQRQFIRLSENPSFVAAGAGTFSFTAPPGAWQARLVTDAPGARTVLASSVTVTVG